MKVKSCVRPRARLSVQTGGRAQRYENYFALLRFIFGENGEIWFFAYSAIFRFSSGVSRKSMHKNVLFVVYSVSVLFCCVVPV